MLRVALLALALASVLPLAPVGAVPPPPCDPSSFPEGASLDRVGVRLAAGPETFYVVTRGHSTIGQSYVEVWEETNGLAGLQTWEGECGKASDRFVARACAFRTGALEQLECPAIQTADLGDFALDHVVLP